MEKGAWTKSPAGLVALFESVFPGPPATARQMFGYPAGFVNGNMFCGLHQESFILRLPEGPAEELVTMGARVFEPMPGRPMNGYYTVPAALLADPATLESWVATALAHAASLPPKAAKASAAKASAKAKPKRP
ncbi:MAG TPA: TfoX/Sxy family protein [Actinomycetota bacterium]|nr:TfoX/Sxy family protein [Actinomycetota bacterium]